MTQTYHIDPATLRKAAEQLMTIDEAGYGHQLDRELYDLTLGDPDFRADDSSNRFWLGTRGNNLERFAERLSDITCCPIEQARGIAAEMLGFVPRRQIAIDLLRRTANDVRRLQAQTAQFAGRAG